LPVKRRAARSIELLAAQPRMYPVRRRGVMRGYRYFVAHGFLFYYSVSSGEVGSQEFFRAGCGLRKVRILAPG
jgi:plasmid stabilization system protein ParE